MKRIMQLLVLSRNEMLSSKFKTVKYVINWMPYKLTFFHVQETFATLLGQKI